jgi:EpsI family protein
VIGDWAESKGTHQLPIFRAEGADEELHRTYVGPGEERLHLYVAYFERQQEGKETANHLTSELHENAQTISLEDSGVSVARNFFAGESSVGEVLFWYDVNARIASNSVAAKAFRIWNGLTRGRTNGALVMIYCEQRVSHQDLDSGLQSFAQVVLPTLRNYLP